MLGTRLELPSAHGDQTLKSVQFVLHGSSEAAGRRIVFEGFDFIEGRASVSTNLLQAYGYATDPLKRSYSTDAVAVNDDAGLISVIALPKEFHLGYAAFTTAFIMRATKLVMGAPLRYAGGRKQLALYVDENTEKTRKQVEADVAAGMRLTERPAFHIDQRYVLGTFKPSPWLQTVISTIEVNAKAFQPIDFVSVEGALTQLFEYREPAQAVLVPSMVRNIVVGTVESVVISRLRMMRWQGLGLLGYRFREGSEDVAVTRVADIPEQRRRMDEYGRMLASSSIFSGDLAWLKTYATNQLDLMRVELDGAELEFD